MFIIGGPFRKVPNSLEKQLVELKFKKDTKSSRQQYY